VHLRSDVSTSRWDEHEKCSKASGFPLHWWVKKWFHRVSQFMDNMTTNPQYVLCGFMPGNPRANHQLTGPRNHFRSWQPAVPFTTPFSRSKQVVSGQIMEWVNVRKQGYFDIYSCPNLSHHSSDSQRGLFWIHMLKCLYAKRWHGNPHQEDQ